MMYSKAVSLTMLALAQAATTKTTAISRLQTCNADNCLRAVRATGLTRGTTDCSSYFQTTVTPSTSTVYVTVTASTIPTVISSVTIRSVVSATATTTVEATETDTADIVATTTEEDTDYLTSTATETITVTADVLDRRAAATPSSNIPAYASPCSGPARYSSACSCIGVKTHTVTASQPTTTSTVTQTVTPSVATIYSDVTTVPVTSTVATVTATVTDATTIVTTTVSTDVVTTTDATSVTTETVVATYTVQPSPTPTFYLRASYPASDASNPNIFGYNVALNGDAYFINFTPNLASAVQFQLDPNTGYVTALNGPAAEDIAFYSTSVGPSSFVLVTTASYAASQGGTQLICSIDANSNLDCAFGSQTAAWWLCGAHLNVVQPGYDFTNTCNAGTAEQISVSVVSLN